MPRSSGQSRPAEHRERRVADVHRRSRDSSTRRSTRSTHQFHEPRGRLALQDRQPRSASRDQARRHAAVAMRHALHDRRHAPRRRRARWRDRRAAVDALDERRRARRHAGRRASSRAAAWPIGPTAAATSGFSTSPTGYQLVALNAKTGVAASPPSATTASSISKVGVVIGKGEQIDLDEWGDRPARHARDHRRRRRAHRLVDVRGPGYAYDAHNTKGSVRAFDVRTGKQVVARSTRFRARASSATTPGRTSRGSGRQRRRLDQMTVDPRSRTRLPAGRDAHHRRVRRQPRPATTCSPRASSRSTTRPARASGTSSWCTIRSGTTTCRRRRCSSTPRSTAGRASWSPARASRDGCTCSIASPASRSCRLRNGRCRSRDVPGEKTSPTQPFPTKPPPYCAPRQPRATSSTSRRSCASRRSRT